LSVQRGLSSSLTRSVRGDHEFALFLSNEIFGRAGAGADRVLVLKLDNKLLRWCEIQAVFAGWSLLRRHRFLHVLRRETNKLDVGSKLSPGVAELPEELGLSLEHHFIDFEGVSI